MEKMTDSRAVEVLGRLRDIAETSCFDADHIVCADELPALDHAIARLREPAGVGGDVEGWLDRDGAVWRRWMDIPHNKMIGARPLYTKAAPQPPAEAQAKGGGEVCIAAHWLENVAAAASLLEASGDVFNVREAAALRKLIASAKDTAPPSAPVGVEAADDGIGEYHIDGVHFDIPGQWTRVALRRAAAQGGGFRLDASGRPVSVDAPVRVEDLMTVYATAFNRCSLDPDDRFSPAFRGIEAVMRALAQQPTAVDADAVMGVLCNKHAKFAEWWGELGERRSLLFMRALEAALAAQPGGSDNGR